jgi:hypothetical protein
MYTESALGFRRIPEEKPSGRHRDDEEKSADIDATEDGCMESLG